MFETWVVSEMYKHRLNAGFTPDLYFWRDSTGHEIDLINETPQGLQAIEVKSGSTYAADWSQDLKKWQKLTENRALESALIYGGTENFERENLKVWGWKDAAQTLASV